MIIMFLPFTGYGHISPSTIAGKIFTMVYALVGMPLFLLYLANIGDIMAKAFKWTYSSCCRLRQRRQQRNGRSVRQAHFRTGEGDQVNKHKKNTILAQLLLMMMS